MIYSDLHADLNSLYKPDVSIVGICGIPIVRKDDKFTFMNNEVSNKLVKNLFIESLGMGAVLTYQNPKNRSLSELGKLCTEKNHKWTEHILSLTVLFNNTKASVRNMFAFDGRFHLSWIESQIQNNEVTFTATANLKDWRRMISKCNDSSFFAEQRRVLGILNDKVLTDAILP